jgi:hypothetical protein
VASYDSADLLLQFDDLAGRPDADEITDVRKYSRLARAQQDVLIDVSPIVPTAFYRTGGPTATTTSGGIVHTFGSDGQGHAVAPLGHVWIGRSTSRYPDEDLVEGVDFINEGTQIRMVNERVESTLYWNGIPTPTDISASQEPALRPAPARRLIVIKAVLTFSREGNQTPMTTQEMEGYYNTEFAKWCLTWKTQFRSGGAVAISSLDRAVLSQ